MTKSLELNLSEIKLFLFLANVVNEYHTLKFVFIFNLFGP